MSNWWKTPGEKDDEDNKKDTSKNWWVTPAPVVRKDLGTTIYNKPMPTLGMGDFKTLESTLPTYTPPATLANTANSSKDGLTLNTLYNSKLPTWEKVLASPLGAVGSVSKAINDTAIGSRFMNKATDGNVPVVGNAGTVPNWLAEQAGGLANLKLQGGETNLFAGGNMIANALPKATKLAQYGAKALGEGANFGLYSGLDTGFKGGSNTDILKSAGSGALMGAGLGVLGKGIGELLPKIKNSAFQENTFKESQAINNPKDILKQPLKPIESTNTPIEQINPTQPTNLKQGDTFSLTTGKLETPLKTEPIKPITSDLKPLDTNTPIATEGATAKVIQPKDILKTDYSKITDEAALTSHISEIQNNIDKNKTLLDQYPTPTLSMNLQLFAQKLEEAKAQLNEVRKTSQFRTNTLDRTTALTDVEKLQIDPKEFDYVTQSSKDWQANAENAVDTNIQQVMNKLERQKALSGGQDAHEAAIISMRLKEQAQVTGNYKPLVNWLKTVSEKTRETARALKGTDTAWEKKSADGAIMDAARVIDNVEENIKKTEPKKIEKIDKQTKETTSQIENAHQEASKQTVKELLPEDLLVNKIDNTLKNPVLKTNNPITDMVNELFKSAKESPLPEKANAIQRNPIEYLKQAIQNKGEYTDVWEKAKTILKDKYRDDATVSATLDDYFNKGIVPTYSENTLNGSIQATMKDLQQKLVDIAKSSQGDKAESLKQITEYLKTNTNAIGADADLLAKNIQTRFDQLVSEKSDSILTNMFKDKPKSVQKNLMEKVQELINLGAYDKQSIRDLIKQKEGLPILESSDIKTITEHMDKAKTFEEGSYAQKKELALAREVIENKTPKTVLGKLNNIQTTAMLSSPKTAIRNTVSNALFRGITDVKNVIRTGLDVPLSKLTGERTSTLPNLKAEGQGFKSGLKDTLSDFKNNVDTRGSDKMELTNSQWDKNGNLLNRTMSNVNRVERVMLTDRPFEGAAYSEEMARQKKLAEINKTPFDEAKAVEKAKHEAAYSTFQDDTFFSKLALNFKKTLNNGKEWGAGDILLKFAKTPANIAARAVDYTPPVALARALKSAINKNGFSQSEFVDQIAKSVTGTGIAGIGYVLGKMGVVTTGGDTNANLNALKQKAGLGNFTINISAINRVLHGGSSETEKGDVISSYDWASPTSVLLTLGANLTKSKTGAQAGSDALEGLTSGFNSLVEQPMTQGLQTLFGSHDVGKAMMSLGANIPQTLIPSIVNNFRQFDNQQKETYNSNILKQGLNQAINRVPIASKLLPNKKDIMGDDKKVMQNNNLANIFLNPATTTRYNPNTSTENALNLYNKTENGDILPKLVDKTISGVKLTPKQYTDYQQDLGERISSIYNSNVSEKTANSLILKAGKEAKANLLSKLDIPKKEVRRCNMDEILKSALSQGLGYGLFVVLLFYVLKQQEKRDLKSEIRETKYQDIITDMSENLCCKIDRLVSDVEQILKK